jgi:site-specific recombinase XerD
MHAGTGLVCWGDTALVKAGGALSVMEALLGHAHIDTTARYIDSRELDQMAEPNAPLR